MRATVAAGSSYMFSKSAATGSSVAAVSARTCAATSSRVALPSGRPSVNAKPELVVASAVKPSCSSTRAEPASHGLGNRNGSPPCSARKASARSVWPMGRRLCQERRASSRAVWRCRLRGMNRAVGILVVIAVLAVLAVPAFGAGPGDCVGDPGDPAAGTPAWFSRELNEVPCGEQRASDTASNPLFAATGAQNLARDGGTVYEGDPFRDPTALNGVRFRYWKTSFADPEGRQLDARVFAPCDATCRDMPAGLQRFEPPYPAVVVVHGGSANQDMYEWGIEPLAEAGYLVLSFQVPTAE